MSLLGDMAPVFPAINASSEHTRNQATARIERARALAEARGVALDAASRVWAGRPSANSQAVLATAEAFEAWLLRGEPT